MTDKCPECGYGFELATNIYDDSLKPREGDISFCIKCGAANMFDTKGIIQVKESELPESTKKEITRIRSAWRRTKRSSSRAG